MTKRIITSILLVSFLLTPLGVFGQATTPTEAVPKLLEEGKEIAQRAGEGIPGILGDVWEDQVLPILFKMEELANPTVSWVWNKVKGPFTEEIEKQKEVLQKTLEEGKQELKESAQEEVVKAGQSLWERFKSLFK